MMGSEVGQVRCIYGSSDCGVARDRQVETNPWPQIGLAKTNHTFAVYRKLKKTSGSR